MRNQPFVPLSPVLADYTHNPEMHNDAWSVHYPTRGEYMRDIEALAKAWGDHTIIEFVAVIQGIAAVAYDGEFGDYVDEITFGGRELNLALDRVERGLYHAN